MIVLKGARMTNLKAKIPFLAPMILGSYCMIQGLLLLASSDLLIQALGVGVLLWVPGCAYYTWKGRSVWARQAPVAAKTHLRTGIIPVRAGAME
jgi:hypothetical protein